MTDIVERLRSHALGPDMHPELQDDINEAAALLTPRPVRVWLRNNGQESAHYGELVKIEDYNGEPGNG